MVSTEELKARALSLLQAGGPEQAEAVARELAARLPGTAEPLKILSNALIAQAHFDEAFSVARDGLGLAPEFHTQHALLQDFTISCAQLGLIALGHEMLERHRASYLTGNASDHAWPGMNLWALGLNDEALASHQAELARFPDDDYLVHQLGVVQMSMGESAGMVNFRRYTTRTFWERFYADYEGDRARMWQGESVDGKSILIRPHGGIGDAIQFVRYARVLAERGAREVILQLPTERIRQFLGSCPWVRFAAPGDLAAADYWVPMFGLPGNLFLDHGPMPAQRYLDAPASRLADAQLALIRRRAAGRRCIAISWHSDMADGSARSVPLGTLLPLFGLPNVHWVVTQRGPALQQFRRSGLDSRCSVVGETSTFDDTSALMAGLDGVVTIESYSVHMAGAMGVPTWFLAGRVLDWRHMNEETRSVWYPSVKLVRQPKVGDWRAAVADLRAQLLML